MCGRFTLCTDREQIVSHFGLTKGVVIKPRYNIAPGQFIPVIRTAGQLEFLTWGLRPYWLESNHTGYINARAETVASKRSFKNAFRDRACLIVADGFYEWKQVGKIKQPYYVTLAERGVFAFAGIWEQDTCAIITQERGAPTIILARDYQAWLEPRTSIAERQDMLIKEKSVNFTICPVSTIVNNKQNDSAVCIQSLQ